MAQAVTVFNCKETIFSTHALKAMIARSIKADDIIEVVKEAEAIAVYPTDKPYPSRLLFKFVNNRPFM